MRDIHEVLRTKELEMEKLRIEIEALRIAAPLLSDDGDDGAAPVSTRWAAPTRPFQVPQAANSEPQPEHAPGVERKNRGLPVATRIEVRRLQFRPLERGLGTPTVASGLSPTRQG